jgi:hypothetical protein
MSALGPNSVRAVTHLDLTAADVDRALIAVRTVLREPRRA